MVVLVVVLVTELEALFDSSLIFSSSCSFLLTILPFFDFEGFLGSADRLIACFLEAADFLQPVALT